MKLQFVCCVFLFSVTACSSSSRPAEAGGDTLQAADAEPAGDVPLAMDTAPPPDSADPADTGVEEDIGEQADTPPPMDSMPADTSAADTDPPMSDAMDTGAPDDTGEQPPLNCNDGVCQPDETPKSCPSDCLYADFVAAFSSAGSVAFARLRSQPLADSLLNPEHTVGVNACTVLASDGPCAVVSCGLPGESTNLVGEVSVENQGASIITLVPPTYLEANFTQTALGGDALSVTMSGEQLPVLAQELVVPPVSAPAMVASGNAGGVASTWDPQQVEGTIRSMITTADTSTFKQVNIFCDAPAQAGAVELPGALVGLLPAGGFKYCSITSMVATEHPDAQVEYHVWNTAFETCEF